MALVAAWNASGNSIDGIYMPGGKTGKIFQSSAATAAMASDGGAISGFSLQMTNNVQTKSAIWTGRKNSSANRGQAFACRYNPTYTGAPSSRKVIFCLSGIAGRLRIEVHHETSGQVSLAMTNELFVSIVTAVNMGAWSPTSGTWYDICFNTPGDTTANGTKITISGSVLGSTTPTGSLSASWSNEFFGEILLGASDLSAGFATQKYEEWAWYDTNVDFTANVDLASGVGLLNGSSRTSLISNVAGSALTVLDGYNTTDPGVANVITTAGAYFISGVSKTPTYVATTAATTKTGTSFGVGLTGTYDGSDRWTDPGDSNVSIGVQYKANSTTNNKTGTLGSVTNLISRATGFGIARRLHGVVR